MTDSPNDLLREAILDNDGFVEAVFQGARGNQANPCKLIWSRDKNSVDVAHGSTSTLDVWTAAHEAFKPLANAAARATIRPTR